MNRLNLVMLLVALFVGAFFGHLMSRASVQRLERELADVKEQLEKAKAAPASSPLAAGLGALFASRMSSRSSLPASEPSGTLEPEDEPADSPAPGAASANGVASPPSAPAANRQAALEKGVAAWKLRQVQAREAFVQAAGLDKEQQEALDQATAQLNEQVRALVQQTLPKVNWQQPQVRDMVDFGVSLGEIYQDADDVLRQHVSDEQLAKAREASFDLFGQVDAEAVLPILEKAQAGR